MGAKKNKLRTAALFKRRSLSIAEVLRWSRLIQERALRFSPYLESSLIALYSPVENEVSTEEIREHALERGKSVFYPKFGINDRVELVRIESVTEFKAGRFGIPEPSGEEVVSGQGLDGLIIFVPGVAFDLQGSRVGRGGGWYDRMLEPIGDKARVVALAYEIQIVEKIPTDNWDQRVHYIITESRVIDCGEQYPLRSGWL
jgi:5-formyltetrahydrofolate cyclo-ligase